MDDIALKLLDIQGEASQLQWTQGFVLTALLEVAIFGRAEARTWRRLTECGIVSGIAVKYRSSTATAP